MSTPGVVSLLHLPRKEQILTTLKGLINDLTGMNPDQINVHANLLESGVDSLTLIQATQLVKTTYHVKLSVVQLLEHLTTIDSLATYIDQELPAEESAAATAPQEDDEKRLVQSQNPATPTHALPPLEAEPSTQQPEGDLLFETQNPAQPPIAPVQVASEAMVSEATASREEEISLHATALEQIMAQQLQVMSEQLEMLRAHRTSSSKQSVQTARLSSAPDRRSEREVESHQFDSSKAERTQPALPAQHETVPERAAIPTERTAQAAPSQKINLAPYIPYQPIEPGAKGGLTPRQQKHLEELIRQHGGRTRESKRLTQQYRPFLADSRTSFGFRLLWKELVYPIIGQRSEGSRIWDVDGNEYVDVSMGFGVHLFGHSPDFIVAALTEQMKEGMQLGPQSRLAGRVAQLISELTGLERVNFCNSGTEAVIGAMRLARTVTGRNKIAMFTGAYHGWSDGTLAKVLTVNGERRTVPIAPGISPHAVEDVLLLDWDDPRSLDVLQEHLHELAAVLVEPVQSRRPDIQPAEFLRELRRLTAKAGVILIFDEMITGFRIDNGGAQAWFGVQADLATYGKVIGGGLPIGVVAGKPAYMDAFDGGMWNYGDDSYPQAEKTIFAGAFFKHPLTMAAAQAVLTHLKNHPSLLPQLNTRTTRLVNSLNDYLAQSQLPIHVVNYGSLFRFMIAPELKYADLFFYHMLANGVFIWEGRNCFLSTAHTEQDLELFRRAVWESAEQMRAGGFWPEPPPASSSPHAHSSALTNFPTTSQPNGELSRPLVQQSGAELRADDVTTARPQFSLYYFGSYDKEFSTDKYELLIEGAKFADSHDFTAVWIPERHFHAFGGFSPNPSVVAAALARETRRLQIRAGSVVLPLHNPIRVAEEWSVVDNLSKGRVGLSFASGWQPNDFVFAPDAYQNRHEHMYHGIEIVQKLWRGESIEVMSGSGQKINVKLSPMPMQPELPTWLTGASAATFTKGGEIGARFLTNLQDQSIEQLAEKIALYRQSLARHGFPPEVGHVTVLLHTFVDDDFERARETARQPLYKYMRSSLGLMSNLTKGQGKPIDFSKVSDEDMAYILSSGYERYARSASLIGTPETCSAIIDELTRIGVDEIACLIDFGVETGTVLESLQHLNTLQKNYQGQHRRALAQSSESSDIISIHASSSGSSAGDGLETDASKTATTGRDEVAALVGPPDQTYHLPLTEAQTQLWVAAQIGDDASRAYNESATLHLRGPLDVAALRHALQQLIERHESLRATFSPDGQSQQIHPRLSLDVPFVDFSERETSRREAEAMQWVSQEVGRPFDLVQGPLVRFRIVKLEEQHHLLVLNNHHLVADGQSWGVLLSDLKAFYTAERQGKPCVLPPPRPFREYVECQSDLQQRSVIADSEAYWVEQFADSIPILELPTDYPRPPVQTYNGARLLISSGPGLFGELKKLCVQHGSTVYVMLLAAYSALLHRLAGQEEIIIGTPAAGQLSIGSNDIVGYCVNLLPLLSQAADNPTFLDHLMAIKRRLWEGYDHQHYSFGSLLKKLNAPWDASRSPLFTTVFNIDRAEAAVQFFDLEINAVTNPTDTARYDLRFNVIESADELQFDCTYNTDLFKPETIRRWVGCFQTLLSSIVVNPQQKLWNLPLLTDAERQQMLVEWNASPINYRLPESLHRMFEAQAERTPDALAIVFEDQEITYRELDQRANRLAHYLRERGVETEATVAVCMERSIEMVVGLLGVLKAGGAFVPFDPTYPQERLAFMFEDTRARMLLTQRRLLENLPAYDGEMLCLDEDEKLWAKGDVLAAGMAVEPQQMAYVFYTSGSTGRPKGVASLHQGVVNFLAFTVKAYELSEADVILQMASLSFDASVRDIIGPLTVGAKVILLNDSDAKDPQVLLSRIAEHRVTCLLSVVPTRLKNLIEAARVTDRSYESLRLLLVSGENLLLADCQQARAVFGDKLALVNLYGPTECTMTSSYYGIENGPTREGVALIGRPIANAQFYLLDEHLEVVPVGVRGEVHIGGVGLARGYLNRPDLTAEKFIPHPFSAEAGSRLYQTGDLARYLPDGNIELLGRLDYQVKIRGMRVEPAEIEAVLRTNEQVRECVVVAREDVPGDKRLVAYIVARRPEAAASTTELRGYLRERLPEYMEPAAFVVLRELPLTPNGKINRRALPAPELSRADIAEAYAAPRNEVERKLAEIWCDVLMLEEVGVNDGFFELGGNSLLGTQVLARVRDLFGVQLSLRSVFESPTIAELAQLLMQSERAGQDDELHVEALKKEGNGYRLGVNVEHLAEEEVDALLDKLLAEEEAL